MNLMYKNPFLSDDEGDDEPDMDEAKPPKEEHSPYIL